MIELSFIERGIVAGVIIGLIAPIIGSFLLVRRVSVISESISHITLTGISAGVLLGTMSHWFSSVSPIFFGLLFAIVGALLTERLRTIYKDFQELAVPIILSTGIGLSAIFISLARTGYQEWYSYLFGSIVSVTMGDIYFILATTFVILLVVLFLYKEFISVSFDHEFAKTSGIPVRAINLIFAILTAFMISMSIKVVGILLIGALIVIPVATSIQLAKSFKQLMILGIIFAELAVLMGMYLSYQFMIATGGMIVIVALFILTLVLVYKKGKQVLVK
ncbi:metal ABC transporter permease [Halalkalibacter hemicellulosilyticus]|uniref:Zinc ABC transporter n=1 Tax=Halalkalibacter hemicellulosilyticusJCM 9152 TaxID=1236971 RepID=W4QFK2_9BACI|nr:metal ABC transporter permease [Halalkalibacter hemicellulosilyticus]GAE30707.1 zinc ABC transporter [Halalkalibacter hemicellulosilyticusJCM 9152]